MYLLKNCQASFAALCLTSCFITNIQAANLVVNGDFETTANGTNKQIGMSAAHPERFTTITGWYTSAVPTSTTNPEGDSFNLVLASGTGEATGALNRFSVAPINPGAGDPILLEFWAASNGGTTVASDGSQVFNDVSPTGGNYPAIDGGFDVGAIDQQMSGFTVWQNCQRSFSWAIIQQLGFEAPVGLVEKFVVSLETQTIETSISSDLKHGPIRVRLVHNRLIFSELNGNNFNKNLTGEGGRQARYVKSLTRRPLAAEPARP